MFAASYLGLQYIAYIDFAIILCRQVILKQENVIQLYYNNRKSMKLQILFRHREAKDRNIAESNYWTISFWSIVSMVVMSGVFSVQVYMVRNMFNDKRKIRT